MDYNEIQENEIEAIKAIYMEDFELIELNHKSWKISKKYKEFRLRLRPMDLDLRDFVEISLKIKIPSYYPKIPPEVSFEKPKGLNEKHLEDLKKIVKKKIVDLTGSEMIFDLADLTLEYIALHNSGSEVRSFHEQMIKRQELVIKEEENKARIEREQQLRLQKEKDELEKMRISKALEEELLRKEKRLEEERRRKKIPQTNAEFGSFISFDHFIKIPNPASDSQIFSFQRVVLGTCLSKAPNNKTYLVFPSIPKMKADAFSPSLIIDEVNFSPRNESQLEAVQGLREVEEILEKLKSIRHPSLLRLYDFKVETSELNSASWRIYVLSETKLFSPNLRNMIRLIGQLNFLLIKKYFRELLSAIQALHINGIYYNYIRSFTVLLNSEDIDSKSSRNEYFDQVVSSVKFQSRAFISLTDFQNDENLDNQSHRLAPEQDTESRVPYKTDIWDLGIVLLEIIVGYSALSSSSSIKELIEIAFKLSNQDTKDLLEYMLNENPAQRPSIQIILKHPFFKDKPHGNPKNNEIKDLKLLPMCTSSSHSADLNQNSGIIVSKSFSDSTSLNNKVSSRYNNDFEELQFLGKGGFGEVVMARNKLDGRIYAVKKVRLDVKESENSRKILREVAALSRLHHQCIVRYYTAWLEDSNGAWDDDDSYSDSSGEDDSDEKSSNFSQIQEADSDFMYTEKSTTLSRRKFSLEEASTSDPSFENSTISCRILYIQMEYCEKSTLRDIIDEGIKTNDIWKIFRQVLEGLDHLHSQGMIHRDLKPSNIFLASTGDVKIGDFGLATSSSALIEYGSRKVSYEIFQGSMTSEIGTSFYMSPEVFAKTSRYNQKVDMYSLGIILFEMIYPLSTGMERALVLRDLRLPEIRFPSNFNFDKLKDHAKIIRSLLNHDEKQRPTAIELLQSDMLPTRMEDEFVNECIRTIANPTAPHYSTLISTLFRSTIDGHKELIYDRKITAGYDLLSIAYQDLIRSILSKIFRRHGAFEVSAPVVMPFSDRFSELQKPFKTLDSNGNIVQHPYDLTLPFARFVARSKITTLKRFIFGKVFRQNIEEDAPIEVPEVDFDIVGESAGDFASEAEVLKVVDEVIEAFPSGIMADYTFQISHGRIGILILEICQIPKPQYPTVALILSQLGVSKTAEQIRSLLGKSQLPRAMIEKLLLFHFSGDFNTIHSRLRKLTPFKPHRTLIDQVFEELSILQTFVRKMGIHRKLIFNSFLMYNINYYKNGILFRAVREGKRGDVLAVGGRYDSLISDFRNPLSPQSKPKFGVGVSLALQKLIVMVSRHESQKISARKNDEDRAFSIWSPRWLDVLVVSFGDGLLEERIEICKDLWSFQIRSDFLKDQTKLTPENLSQTCRNQGANWAVIVKSSKREGLSVKVKNIIARVENEVPISELAVFLASDIAEQSRIDIQAANRRRSETTLKVSTEDEGSIGIKSELNFTSTGNIHGDDLNIGPFNVNVVGPASTKANPKRKRLLMDRALEAIIYIARYAFKANTLVLVLEVPREGLHRLIDCSLYDSERFKKGMSNLPSTERSILESARNFLIDQNSLSQIAWLYSVKDDCALFYQLSHPK